MDDPKQTVNTYTITAKDTDGAAKLKHLRFKEIWCVLSQIDCTEHVQTITSRGIELKYLSWAWAWGILMEHFPNAEFSFKKNQNTPDGADGWTVSVFCEVTIGECRREMWLPVMDNRNNAIICPDARQISDAKMRCLVKVLAIFGLGHYIFTDRSHPFEYTGEDLPLSFEDEETLPEADKSLGAMIYKDTDELANHQLATITMADGTTPNDVANWSPDATGDFVNKMINLVRSTATDLDGMRSFITNNTAVLDDIKKYHAGEADRFRGALREIKDNFSTPTISQGGESL